MTSICGVAGVSRRVLELDLVLEQIAGNGQSSLGSDRIRALAPAADLDEVERRHDEVEQARDFAAAHGFVACAAAVSIDADLAAVAVAGVVLEPAALRRVAATARVCTDLRQRYLADPGRWPALAALVERAPSLHPLCDHIDRLIDEEGQVRDDASPELQRIRRRAQRLRDGLRGRLEKLARDPSLGDVLQDALVTERGGRMVVPVRAGQRDRLPGVVHDASSSGQTIFVEPLDVLDDQNRVAEIVAAEREEIRRLLSEASGHVSAAHDALMVAQATVAAADGLQAIARYAEAEGAVRPQWTTKGLRLRGARHPLLDSASAVPLDLEVPAAIGALVITGPNTGGKTVALKTVGLLAAMAQCGLPVPAAEAVLALFPRIYADIGDEQSVAANLSTFSGHLRHIVDFVSDCPAGSLVLLDELGTGTDPAEGAALGIALVERFLQADAVIVISTHHDALKSFAHRRDDVLNAAMEFDAETLAPTYRVRLGRPGRSNALEIAARHGVDAELIERAKGLLTSDTVQLDAVIRDLESDTRTIERERDELAGQRTLLEAERERLERLDGARVEAQRAFEREADEAVKHAVEALRERGESKLAELESGTEAGSELVRADRRASWAATAGQLHSEARSAVHDSLRGRRRSATPSAGESELDLGALRRGEAVQVAPFGLGGAVLHEWDPDTGDAAAVEVGVDGKRLVVRRDQITRDREGGKRRRSSSSATHRRPDVGWEIDLHGKRVEEALAAVERYLDDAVLAGLPEVRLIHGLGKLRLRDAIQRYLGGRPDVVRFATADPTSGGGGVTIVRLED
ncbi:MAG TPA: endonuclease MutS2 [Acidobacteriota bacterium]|nr:endonuclease MutS2 [Acidobacteriota bacterium]